MVLVVFEIMLYLYSSTYHGTMHGTNYGTRVLEYHGTNWYVHVYVQYHMVHVYHCTGTIGTMVLEYHWYHLYQGIRVPCFWRAFLNDRTTIAIVRVAVTFALVPVK